MAKDRTPGRRDRGGPAAAAACALLLAWGTAWWLTLKIDKSFVDRLSESRDTSLVDAILSMASTLGLTTVAEGVEHEHQRATLAAHGCATGQGFHFSPPVEAYLVPELLLRAQLRGAGSRGGEVVSGAATASAPA